VNTAKGFVYYIDNVKSWVKTKYGAETNNTTFIVQKNLEPQDRLTKNWSFVFDVVKYKSAPIVWANCTFKVINCPCKGWWSENSTKDERYLIVEKIYVIKNFLVKVTKHVIWNETAKAWDVYIVVENIGGEDSPNLWIYDLIPENLSMVNGDWDWSTFDADWINNSNKLIGWGNTSSNLPSGYGEGVYWHISSLNHSADGDGAYDDWSEIANNQSVVIHYQMNGTGEFHPIDAFVIGIDPMFSMNSQTAHKITLVSGAKATSYESLMALLTGVVVGFIKYIRVYSKR
jgi:hypothetical protein